MAKRSRYTKRCLKMLVRKQGGRGLVAHGYAMLAIVALLFALFSDSSAGASVRPRQNLDLSALEEILDRSMVAQPGVRAAGSRQYVKSLFELFTRSHERVTETEVVVANGDTFTSLMARLGFGRDQSNRMYSELKKVFDPRGLRAGQKIVVRSVLDTSGERGEPEIRSLAFIHSASERFVLERAAEAEEFIARHDKDELTSEIKSAAGVIDGSLSVSMAKDGLPKSAVSNFISIFAFSVDFSRDVRKGDSYEIVYETYRNPKGEIVKTGNILYAALALRRDRLELYRFEDAKGQVDYYNEKGIALKKTLDKKPLALKNARISSPFGKRRHPIYGDLRIHWGTDYAAPQGTPVFASGDGVVQMAQYHGGYGKFIKIRHNSEYTTAYGHLSAYAKGIVAGTRVKQGQTIGYVGSTGNSTGPHLHFEVVRDGRRVNPTAIRASTGENLAGADLKKFEKTAAGLWRAHPSLFAGRAVPADAKVASADAPRQAKKKK